MLTVKLPQIFRVHQVPRVRVDVGPHPAPAFLSPSEIFWEDGIMSGYRHPKSSALDCVLSSFQMTNETINIWTHFLPTWYFVWRLLVLSSSLDFCREPYHWPLLIYLLLVCLYPFASSCAHTFSTMSARARHFCYFCDYGALSLYSLGCAFAYGAYAMPDRWVGGVLHRYFVPAAAFNSFVCTGLSCYSRSSSAAATRPWPATATTSSSPCSPASSSPPTCPSAWRPAASTTSATATSSSTSAPCWAPTSSWKPCCATPARAAPGCAAACPAPPAPAPSARPGWPCWATPPSSAPSPPPCPGHPAARRSGRPSRGAADVPGAGGGGGGGGGGGLPEGLSEDPGVPASSFFLGGSL
ncbi:membrane progestin receptor delta isoform X2 [Struthio camelus]|uniref:membrane progestin receptor delta isoform X2 n=1 Tax=Struthio camelus TaxID=8801 RepID=UPI00360410FA